jgi:hypothetical protein
LRTGGVRKGGFRCEFEFPPHTKVRVVATVDRRLCEEMERIHLQEIEHAKAEDRVEPDWSNTLEMLLRKGVRSYKTNHKGLA